MKTYTQNVDPPITFATGKAAVLTESIFAVVVANSSQSVNILLPVHMITFSWKTAHDLSSQLAALKVFSMLKMVG